MEFDSWKSKQLLHEAWSKPKTERHRDTWNASRENQQEYKPGDFCRNAGCENFAQGSCVCDYPEDCIRTAIEFHDWLKQNGYRILEEG